MGESWGNQLRRFPQTPSLGFFPLAIDERRYGTQVTAKTMGRLRAMKEAKIDVSGDVGLV